ncbi:MAG: xanthine phosphoribosyltransferase [Firmicutes bacterium]|nr:xanthine phosphoribosyltransferase [Bacillota bacterium]
MKLLEDRILKEGTFLPGGIVRVDSFLNHQLDPALLWELGKEFARSFAQDGVTKILTVEASGIAIAVMAGLHLDVPVVFAKKAAASNLGSDDIYTAKVHSFTKNTDCMLNVSSKYISPDDRVLIIDDFLAMGEAVSGLRAIINQAGASLAGVGIAIEKDFQPGGKKLREEGIKLVSLAVVSFDENGDIAFKAYQ